MTLTSHDELLIRRYLLGNVAADEQRLVEERLLADDDYYSCLCKSESDLIDEYVRGVLTPDDRLRFERLFLNSPDRRESVAFAGVLNACLSTRISRSAVTEGAAPVELKVPVTRPSRSRSLNVRMALPYVATFIVVALASAVALLLIQTGELRKQIEQSRLERAALEQREDSLQKQLAEQIARSNSLSKELERERVESSRRELELASVQHPTAKPQAGLVYLALEPGRTRAEQPRQTVTLLPDVRQVLLSLTIGDSLFERYVAEVQNDDFETIRTLKDLKPVPPDGRTVVITIPARLLTRSDYLVRLSGVTGKDGQKMIATYYFNVARK